MSSLAVATPKPQPNRSASLFGELHRTFNRDTNAPEIETIAANLAASIAAEPHTVCLGIFAKDEVRKIYGLTHLCSQYGVTLRSKRRQDGWVLIYGEIEPPVETQFMGAVVGLRVAAQRAAA